MTHRTLAATLLLATLSALPAPAQNTAQDSIQNTPPTSTTKPATPARAHHIVFALTSADPIDWNLTLGNIRNLTKAFDSDPLEIEVVVYGPAIVFLKSDTTAADDIKAAQATHVRFLACANSMRAHDLAQADLIPGAEIVPAGIAEVVRKQEAGWTYIKAGR